MWRQKREGTVGFGIVQPVHRVCPHFTGDHPGERLDAVDQRFVVGDQRDPFPALAISEADHLVLPHGACV